MTDENGKHLGKHKLPSNLVLKKLIFGLVVKVKREQASVSVDLLSIRRTSPNCVCLELYIPGRLLQVPMVQETC